VGLFPRFNAFCLAQSAPLIDFHMAVMAQISHSEIMRLDPFPLPVPRLIAVSGYNGSVIDTTTCKTARREFRKIK
jgi:hypothetical protein